MEWLWLGFGILSGWAMLSLMGNERQRQRYIEEARQSAEKAIAAATAAAPGGPAH